MRIRKEYSELQRKLSSAKKEQDGLREKLNYDYGEHAVKAFCLLRLLKSGSGGLWGLKALGFFSFGVQSSPILWTPVLPTFQLCRPYFVLPQPTGVFMY